MKMRKILGFVLVTVMSLNLSVAVFAGNAKAATPVAADDKLSTIVVTYDKLLTSVTADDRLSDTLAPKASVSAAASVNTEFSSALNSILAALKKIIYTNIFLQSKYSKYHEKVTYALIDEMSLYENSKIPNAKTIAEKNGHKQYIMKRIQNFKKTHVGEISKAGNQFLDSQIIKISKY